MICLVAGKNKEGYLSTLLKTFRLHELVVTAALKLTPMELMERLVALVPRPRVHLTRFHGVLAPHYKHRKQIVWGISLMSVAPTKIGRLFLIF